jgi:hypothetical protein
LRFGFGRFITGREGVPRSDSRCDAKFQNLLADATTRAHWLEDIGVDENRDIDENG